MSDWNERANCRGTDPEVFFPEKGSSTHSAKRLCARCDVREDCLQYSIDTRQTWGVWGGLSRQERRPMLDELDEAPADPDQHEGRAA